MRATLMSKPPRWFTPARATFIASLFLSFLAWAGSTVNRDGMLYVRTAQAYLDGGFSAAHKLFNWPFLSIAMAMVADNTGLSPEHAGYLINAIFMAGACALMVACTQRQNPSLAWISAFVVLALPGLNEYRNELIREFGSWFFIMLSFWLALRSSSLPLRWGNALSIQLALGAAALFRPEALMLFPALIAWQFFSTKEERWPRSLMLGILPLLGAVVLAAFFFTGNLASENRLVGELGRISTDRFMSKADVLASSLIDYARNQAPTILFFGSLALIPVKLVTKFGILLLPLGAFGIRQSRIGVLRQYAIFAWAIATHLMVLSIFVLDLQFLAGRYVGLILLLSVPFVSHGLHRILNNSSRWRFASTLVLVILALSNVISTSGGKTHYVDAGHWLAKNVTDTSTVYIDSGRTAYHAGWLYMPIAERGDHSSVDKAMMEEKHDLYVLEISGDPTSEAWLNQSGLQIVKYFPHAKGNIVIAKPKAKHP